MFFTDISRSFPPSREIIGKYFVIAFMNINIQESKMVFDTHQICFSSGCQCTDENHFKAWKTFIIHLLWKKTPYVTNVKLCHINKYKGAAKAMLLLRKKFFAPYVSRKSITHEFDLIKD